MSLYILYEHSAGLALFERVQMDEVSLTTRQVQESITDLQRFSKLVKMKAFQPFSTQEGALEVINAISMSEVTPFLADFLERNFPKSSKKKNSAKLGLADPKLAQNIQGNLNIKCVWNSTVLEMVRGIREHFHRFLKALSTTEIAQSQMALGHSYSRCKVKMNVHREDNMIVQSIALLDQMDKNLNTFAMRCKEWYSYHFPELVKIVPDAGTYCRVAAHIKDKASLKAGSQDQLDALAKVIGGEDAEEKAEEIVRAKETSTGQDISAVDVMQVEMFASRVADLCEYRKELHDYLCTKMDLVAPNLTVLIGELVGARLISHAGSLTSLSKHPASTLQILGAEKALFRALKTKGNTPKYGLIFNSTFIGRAAPKDKGKISRFLANKCSMAARIDAFDDQRTSVYGRALRQQVEDRLEFFKTGKAPKKNIDVMRRAIALAKEEAADTASMSDDESGSDSGSSSSSDSEKKVSKKDKKDKKKKAKKAKKAKKSKKKVSGSKRGRDDDEDEAPAVVKKAKKGKSTKKDKKSKKKAKKSKKKKD